MLSEFLGVLFGAILGFVSERWIVPPVARWMDQTAIKRAVRRARLVKQVPSIPPEFQKYSLGNIEIPVMNLFGSPHSPFSSERVKIEYEPITYHQEKGYPQVLSDAAPYLERLSLDKSPGNWVDNTLLRLSDYTQEGETQTNEPGNLTLHFKQTSFFTFVTTNRMLDYPVVPASGPVTRFVRNQTIREAFVSFPYELAKSVLANPLSTEVVVISRNLDQVPNSQVIIRRRSDKVAFYRGFYQTSAAGFMTTAHRDSNTRLPSPFVTAICEAREEIADVLQLAPADFKMIGICVNWEDMDLNAYGYIETGLPVRTLLGDFRRDAFEGWPEAIPFDPGAVLSHIGQHRWYPVSVLAMCAALLAHFDRRQVETVARSIPAKNVLDFLENS